LEKQANNSMRNNTKRYICLLVVFFTTLSYSQMRPDFESGKKYFLKKVSVTGKISYNELTVVTFSGLEKGQELTVPGEEITQAVKKLGKLGIFSDIDFYVDKIEGDSISLELNIIELPKLDEVKFTGVKKSKAEELIKDNALTKGKIVNENLITKTKNYIENKYKKDGFYNSKVFIRTIPDSTNTHVNMLVNVDKGKKIKIEKINTIGNKELTNKQIRSAMKNTKQENPIRVFKASKFIKSKYNEDLDKVVDKYKEKGFRDARIVYDSVKLIEKKRIWPFGKTKTKSKIVIDLKVEEGKKYYFGNIKFLGNSVYTDQQLAQLLDIKKGDVYNGVLLDKRIADKTKPDADDITNLYQNNGYLFSTVNAVEVKTANDTIDFEIRIVEGPIAYFNKITVVGNEKTNDRVIYRELMTRPGEKYSKEAVVNTVREIGQLGFFDPESIDPKFKNVDPTAGTVDIEYNLVEKGASQIELQGGYGGGGFIGTLGLSFNNFSIQNIFKKDAYKPLPMGDGQKMSLRAQAASYFRTFSLSLTEPWFGGKKPISLSTSISYSKQYLYTGYSSSVDRSKSFNIFAIAAGINKRLTVPDRNFYFSTGISYQHYDLQNYFSGLFTFGNGTSRNLSFNLGLTRNNKAFNPVFPIQGAEFSVNAKFSPPYSLINGIDYGNLKNEEAYKTKYVSGSYSYTNNDNGEVPAVGDYIKYDSTKGAYIKVDDYTQADTDQAKVDQKRFNWLEYYKIKFKADVYTPLFGSQSKKLVLRTLGEFSYLGNYNSARGTIPFERFYLGGDGLANYSLDGREVIQLRGYPNQSLTPLNANGTQSGNGATIYNKFTMELRYPITLKQAASIFVLGFVEGGASYRDFKTYNPFAIQRSAGAGVRIFMPAFGLLGIDFAHGFDPVPGTFTPSGWQTHFIIGQQF